MSESCKHAHFFCSQLNAIYNKVAINFFGSLWLWRNYDIAEHFEMYHRRRRRWWWWRFFVNTAELVPMATGKLENFPPQLSCDGFQTKNDQRVLSATKSNAVVCLSQFMSPVQFNYIALLPVTNVPPTRDTTRQRHTFYNGQGNAMTALLWSHSQLLKHQQRKTFRWPILQ